jgi:hypothetical protein
MNCCPLLIASFEERVRKKVGKYEFSNRRWGIPWHPVEAPWCTLLAHSGYYYPSCRLNTCWGRKQTLEQPLSESLVECISSAIHQGQSHPPRSWTRAGSVVSLGLGELLFDFRFQELEARVPVQEQLTADQVPEMDQKREIRRFFKVPARCTRERGYSYHSPRFFFCVEHVISHFEQQASYINHRAGSMPSQQLDGAFQ